MPQVEELFSRWEQASAQGSNLTIAELCADCPELIEAVTARIRARRQGAASGTQPSEPGGTVAQTLPLKEPAPAGQVGFELTFADLRFHARGGLGEVYIAQDQQLARDVALKFIPERRALETETQERFLREAEVTGRLDHPGVVPVHGVGRAPDGRPFYAMRFIHGETLEAAIQRFYAEPKLPGQRSVAFRDLLSRFISVCNTIAYAHNRGIVHRDLKPDNVMLGKYGETLVVDWGLALPVGRDQKAKASGEKTLLPRSGSHSSDSAGGGGTPSYMSPEQADLQPEIGPASDIYSLGATLYKVLTGETPFKGSQVREILDLVRRGQFRPPSAVRKDIDPALEAICQKAMALRPADRYASALDLARDLQHWLADEPVVAYPEPFRHRAARWSRRHRTLVQTGLAGLVAVLLIAVVSAILLGKLAGSEREARQQGLQVSARFAARTVASEIDLRWRILESEANDPDLQKFLLAASDTPLGPDGSPKDATARAPLQNWLNDKFLKHGDTTKSSTWFVTDRRGILWVVAGKTTRDPATFLGKNFAHRDYFHGKGGNLTPAEAAGIEPISAIHLSTVFLGENDQKLKVAFSVPVRNERSGPVIGVLAMTLELGQFAALQTQIGSQQIAVLAQTRSDWVEGSEKQGLILHHPRLVQLRREGSPNQIFRFDAPYVARLKELEALRLWQEDLGGIADQAKAHIPENVNLNYHDPVGGTYQGSWLAACEPVLIPGRPAATKDTGWIVIAQERK